MFPEMESWYNATTAGGPKKIMCLSKTFTGLDHTEWTDADKWRIVLMSGIWRWSNTKLGDNLATFEFKGALKFVFEHFPLEHRQDAQALMRIVVSPSPGDVGMKGGYLTYEALRGKCTHPMRDM